MAAVSAQASNLAAWWRKFAVPEVDCVHSRAWWNRVRLRPAGILLQGRRYCLEHCLAEALGGALQRLRQSQRRQPVAHRIPLGLLLLSRQQLSAEQLQVALEWQRTQAGGRLGECLQALGFVTEQQVTAALARQWSCPVLHTPVAFSRSADTPPLPFSLLSRFLILPVEYVRPASTLYIAFAQEVDYSLLYAIEQMTGCRTEACLAIPSFIRGELQGLTAGRRRTHEIALEQPQDNAEICRIIAGYCARLGPDEIRMAQCAPYLWIRLLQHSRPPFDLLFGSDSATTPMRS